MLIITAVVLWSYYAYVFALCLCKYDTLVLFVSGVYFFGLRSRRRRRLPHSRVDKTPPVRIKEELAK